MKNEVYAKVTKKIIDTLKEGKPAWIKPWTTGNVDNGMPSNAERKTPYSGVNVMLLWLAALEHGYSDNRWLTFKQAQKLGGNIRKGEHGTKIVFAKNVNKAKKNDDDKPQKFFMMAEYTVFNVEQAEGIKLAEIKLPTLDSDLQRHIAKSGATIRYGGDVAGYYGGDTDSIIMPPLEAFKSDDAFLATAYHELGHWTGHESRLNRDMGGRFKSASYAAEELVAELTSAFLSARFGKVAELQHAGYIGGWITLLEDDDKAIFTAARMASDAADYIGERLGVQDDALAA